jgi:hypothetical protein
VLLIHAGELTQKEPPCDRTRSPGSRTNGKRSISSGSPFTLRWVLLHLIEETARHAGHADIVRESIDGATCHSLMAAVEGWPATEWLQPWQPAGPIGA